jgi:hypothetical protein
MSRLLAVLLALCALSVVFAGCSGGGDEAPADNAAPSNAAPSGETGG